MRHWLSRAKQSTFQAPVWQRNLAVLWVGELIAIAGFSVTMPFLPYYVQDLGIAGLEQVAFWAGLLTTAQATTMALIAPVWGTLADRYGRKIMVVRAMFGGAIVIGMMGFVQNVQQLLVLRTIQGLLTGTVPAATTLVVSNTPPTRRGSALGLLQMAIFLGSSVGPFLGGYIADNLGYQATFWVTGALLLVAGVLVSTFVHEEFTAEEEVASADDREGPDDVRRRPPPFMATLWAGLAMVFTTGSLMVVFAIRMLNTMSAQIVSPMMSLYVQDIAPAGVQIASLTGLIAGLSAAASAVGAVALGRVADRFGPRPVLLVCGLAACVLYALQAGVQTVGQLMILRAISGLATGGILSAVSALLAALAPAGRYGAVYGVNTSMVAAANAIAPMIGAALTARWGLHAVFLGAAVMYGAAVLIAAFAVPARPAESVAQPAVD